MTAGKFEFPSWQVPLQEAILEMDREKFGEKLKNASTVIFERLRQNNSPRERQALDNAVRILRLIARDTHAYCETASRVQLEVVHIARMKAAAKMARRRGRPRKT